MTYERLPQKKELWICKNNSDLQGWRPKQKVMKQALEEWWWEVWKMQLI